MIRSAVRRVVRDDRCSAPDQAFENLGLGVRDSLFGTQVLDVRRRDRRDESDVRPYLRGQRPDLAGVVHAHFKHRIIDVAGHARET